MKILVICQYYYPEPLRISDVCETLVKNGHHVTVLTGLPNYPEGRVLDEYRFGRKRIELINGVKVIRCFEIGRGKSRLRLSLNYFSFLVSATLKTLFMKEKFDIVFVYQLSPVLMVIPAIIYKRKYNKKILLYCLDLWPASLVAGGIKEGSLLYKLFLIISKWIYNSVDRILVTSYMFIDYFQDILGIDIDNGSYLPQYAEDLFIQSVDVFRKNNRFNFVFAGNIGEMQSVETIIKAANILKKYKNVTFHIVGNGSKLEECKRLAHDLRLDNVLFYGRRPVSEMSKFYGMADAMLVTLKEDKYLSYTLPGKVQSYMASGKAIIGAINGETQRVIKKAQCGFCCSAEDYKGLADLIVKFCNSDKKKQMAFNSRKFYIENYCKEKFFAKLENEILNLEAK